VEELAESEDAPSLDEDGCPIFEWVPGTPIDDGVPNEGLHFTGNDNEYEYDTEDDEDSVEATEDDEDSVEAEDDDAYKSGEDTDYNPASDEASVRSNNTEEEFDNTLTDMPNQIQENANGSKMQS